MKNSEKDLPFIYDCLFSMASSVLIWTVINVPSIFVVLVQFKPISKYLSKYPVPQTGQ